MKAVTADILFRWSPRVCEMHQDLNFPAKLSETCDDNNCMSHDMQMSLSLVGTLVWQNDAYNGTYIFVFPGRTYKKNPHKERCGTNKQKDEVKLSLRAHIHTLYI